MTSRPAVPDLPQPPPTATLDELLAVASAKYDVRFEPVKVGQYSIDILQIADMEAYIDKLAQLSREEAFQLPFWAKVWPTALLLSYFAQRFSPTVASAEDPTVQRPRRVLEIGAGVGLCGLFAAMHGMDATITDIHPDAVLFTRINILKNGLQDRARALRVDFTQDRLNERFDLILGCEVLYLEDSFRGLAKFLERHIEPARHSEVVLARDYSRKASRFFKLAEREFHVMEQPLGAKSEPAGADGCVERRLSSIYRLKVKKHA